MYGHKILDIVGKLVRNEELDDEEIKLLNSMTEEEIEEWKEIYQRLRYDY